MPDTQPQLDIKQGSLLPMPAEKPIEVDTGYRETPDGLTTTGYTTQPATSKVSASVNVAFPSGHVVQFPDEATAQQHSPSVWEQLKNETGALYDQTSQAVGALSQGLGGPSTLKEAYEGMKNTPTGFEHPYESLKAAVTGVVGGLNSGRLLDAAKQSWDAGDKVTAARHFVNALIPFVGANSDLAGNELISGQTGKAVGHTLAAVAPFILGAAEKAPQAEAVPTIPNVAPKGAGLPRLPLREAVVGESGEMKVPFTGTDVEHDVPTFFSKAERVANEKLPANASGEQILATLRNNGVKQNEIDWMGLDDFLKDKPRVSKADLQQFINEQKIQLEETTLGGNQNIYAALSDLRKQRGEAAAVNNRTYADDLRYHPDTPLLFNAMKEGKDVDGIIAKMPPNLQESARKFVDSENQIHAIDKQITDLQNQVGKPAKYESYTLPGPKDNYNELLLRLPDSVQDKIDAINKQMDAIADRPAAEHDAHPEWMEQWDALNAQRRALQAQSRPQFKSGHFDEPNILAHVRFDDRTLPDGKKALFLEEVQSDWAQKGKHEGFANPAPAKLPDGVFVAPDGDKFQVVNREGNPLLSRTFDSEQEANAAALHHYGEGAGNPGVPDMPFKQDWHELALKRMLRYAADNGYDSLAWTTGEQQAARYDLSKQISRVSYVPGANILEAWDAYGDKVLDKYDIPPEQVSDYIGKEPAKRLLDSAIKGSGEDEFQEISGLDLKIGGEWAKALYDRSIPNFLNKYAKKWGAKVGTSEVSTTNPGALRYEIVDPKGQVQDAFRNKEGAEDAVRGYQESHRGPGKWTIRDNGSAEKVWHLDITPEMKQSLLKQGQPIAKVETPSWQDRAIRFLGSQEVA
jgi:hypothetical protein